MTPPGFIPKAAATSLGSIVLTRSTRRVDMADIGGRGWGVSGLGAFGDYHVGVVGALVLAMDQAAVQDCPAHRIHWHWLRSFSQPNRAIGEIDVVDPQMPHFAAGGCVQ
jgi:hypothetical protein